MRTLVVAFEEFFVNFDIYSDLFDVGTIDYCAKEHEHERFLRELCLDKISRRAAIGKPYGKSRQLITCNHFDSDCKFAATKIRIGIVFLSVCVRLFLCFCGKSPVF